MCDDGFLQIISIMEKTLFVYADLLVDVMVIFRKAAIVICGVKYVWERMHSSELKIPYGCTMFTEIHIHMKGLLPVLLHAFENKDKIGRAIMVMYRGDIHGDVCTVEIFVLP